MRILFCTVIAVAMFILGSQPADAVMSKKQKEAYSICFGAFHARNDECGKLSNTNEIDKCLRNNDAKLARCKRKAAQMAPVQTQPGDAETDAPVLSAE